MPVELRSANRPKVSDSRGHGAAAAAPASSVCPTSPAVGGLYYGPETYILVADAGRQYRQVRENGALKRVTAVLFPWNYAFPISGSLMRCVCPVDACDLEAEKLRGLSNHWRNKHKSTAFRDNSDRTISEIGTCKVSNVVEQAPNVVVANVAAAARPHNATRKRKTATSETRSPAKRSLQTTVESANDEDEHENDEGNGYHQAVDDDNGRSTPDTPQTLEQAQEGTAAGSGETTEDVFLAQHSAIMAQTDSRSYYSQDTFDVHCAYLSRTYGHDDNIHVFPSTFWDGNSAKQRDALMSSRSCDYLVFLVDKNTHWHGVFVNLTQTTLTVAILDPFDHCYLDASDIKKLLTSHGLLRPHQIRHEVTSSPDHGLPRTPGDERGLFLIRGLECFFQDPARFFFKMKNEKPLYFGGAGRPTFKSAYTTHESLIRTHTDLLNNQMTFQLAQHCFSSIKRYTNNDPAKQSQKLGLLMNHVHNIIRGLRNAGEDRAANTELVTEENQDHGLDQWQNFDEAQVEDCDPDPDQTQDQIIVQRSPSIEVVPGPETGEPVLTLVVEPVSSHYDASLHTDPSAPSASSS